MNAFMHKAVAGRTAVMFVTTMEFALGGVLADRFLKEVPEGSASPGSHMRWRTEGKTAQWRCMNSICYNSVPSAHHVPKS